MSKDFVGDIKKIAKDIGYKKTAKGRPKTSLRVITKSSEEGVKEGETRATFIVNIEALNKIKAIAYWERSTIKIVVHKALQEYITSYENRKGKIKAINKGEV
jgi:pyruvate-formate lyase-activating enzyme